MLVLPFALRNFFLIIPYVIVLAICYTGLIRKMKQPLFWGTIPVVAEWKLTTILLRFHRSFWRPFIASCILLLFALYLNPIHGSGRLTALGYIALAILIYNVFLFRLYYRVARSFGKGIPFTILMWLLPPIGLGILAFGKAEYYGAPLYDPPHKSGPFLTLVKRFSFVLVSLAEVVAVVLGVGYFSIQSYPPRIIVNDMHREVLEEIKDVGATGEVVTRENSMGEAVANLDSMPASREKFFPDHSSDENVVVIGYVIGADLEERAGLASVNIAQMIDASSKGSNLTFVLQTGGSWRWFTKGIHDGTYGRYTVQDGKLTKVESLSDDTCMSEPEEFAAFLAWVKENYPADRYMLTLWDHGGGLSSGYGMDAQNKRSADVRTLSVAELVQGVEQSGLKFDVIGFDACLMQTIETAVAFEPYADYYLASEEVEGGLGWFYTPAFGALAENPGLPSEEFGRLIIASYDAYNTATGNGDEPNTKATLSFVDLPRAKAAYQQLSSFFGDAKLAVAEDTASFAHISLAGTKAYSFDGNEQIDLIDFLEKLYTLDTDDRIFTEEECDELVNWVKACIVYRNANSAEGINGMALSLPLQYAQAYSGDYTQLKTFSFDEQTSFYNDIFSIIAAQNEKERARNMESDDFMARFGAILSTDLTQEEWYVSGFEDYDTTETLIDIPLTEVEDGYQIELPEKTWDIIADSQLIVYQKTEDDLIKYIGIEGLGAVDENGHPMVAMDGTWVFIDGKLVAYEDTGYRETEEGIVFTGKVKARLNGSEDITLWIEWDPVPVTSEGDLDVSPVSAHIEGYTINQQDGLWQILGNLGVEVDELSQRGMESLNTGDKIEFLFDYYDAEGNLVKTDVDGSVRVKTMEKIQVTEKPLDECDVVFGGVLTDVYQRVMTTEKIEAHIPTGMAE